MASQLAIFVFFAMLVSTSGDLDIDAIGSALETDGECNKAGTADCALNALQRQGRASTAMVENQAEAASAEHRAAVEEERTFAIEDAKEAAAEAAQQRLAANKKKEVATRKAKKAEAAEQDAKEAVAELQGETTEKSSKTSFYCNRYIDGSSCMVMNCDPSRGLTECGMQTGYKCKCAPGFCSNGQTCVSEYTAQYAGGMGGMDSVGGMGGTPSYSYGGAGGTPSYSYGGVGGVGGTPSYSYGGYNAGSSSPYSYGGYNAGSSSPYSYGGYNAGGSPSYSYGGYNAGAYNYGIR
eukprot:TRINITY_DN895_c0_g1_i4.p1 TRINITY_DN895_c0_g1~~TRINITY_DN895_c0_g1_i4.p1  ORF type:complete len:294 (-),score=70.24 TRINITY_DN895_c0_g1_i4:225-1106(-)